MKDELDLYLTKSEGFDIIGDVYNQKYLFK